MMEENKSIIGYIGQMFSTYGAIVTVFIVFGIIIGDMASGYSTLFSLGKDGFSLVTLAELLLMSAVITVAQILFLTDNCIKKMSIIARNVCFFGTITAVSVVFAIVFAWFPIAEAKAWAGFIVSFLICTAISVLLSKLRENAENKKMEKALLKFQKEN